MKGFNNYLIMIYDSNGTAAAIIESIPDFMRFFNYKNRNTAASALSHHLRGDVKYLTDEKNRHYTAAKIYESELQGA